MINRPCYLNQLIKFKDHEQIKVVTGIRRCGKSTLLKLFAEYLMKSSGVAETNIIQMNFEDMQYDKLTYSELNDFILKKLETTDGKVYLLFDEIQKIEKWELAINSLRLNNRTDIYITGSNAYLLSSQLATYLSGRYVEIKMHPLSFREFLDFNNFEPNFTNEQKFNLFLKYGGMPGLKVFNFDEQMINQALEGIFSTVLTRDIIEQAEVKHNALLKKIIMFLADNIGNSTNISKIKNTLISENSVSRGVKQELIDNYIMLLENAFVFYGVKRYDIKGKEYLKTQGKYYISDIGLRNYLLGFRNMDRGHVLENIVFLELLNRGYRISIGKTTSSEIDFIVIKPDERKYIQVCETLQDKKTRERELNALKSIKDNYEKIILTMDNIFIGNDYDGIKIINIIDWLIK